MRIGRAFGVGLVAVLAMSACGGSNDDGDSSDGTTTLIDNSTTLAPTTTVAEPVGFELAWKVPIDGTNEAVVVGSHVFVLDGARVRAFALEDGTLAWTAELGLGAPLEVEPIGDDLIVSAAVGGGEVVRLDGATGEEKWRTDTKSINAISLLTDADGPQIGVVISSFGAGFRRLDLETGALSAEVAGMPRAVSATRVLTITDDGLVTFTDLATMEPAAPPLDLGFTYGFDAVDLAGDALLMVNTQELSLLDATGTFLAKGRVGGAPILAVQALGDDRALSVGAGGSEIQVRDGDRYDEAWRDNGFAFATFDGDHAYVIGINGSTLTVVDASADEPAPLGSIDLGGTDQRTVDPVVRNGVLFVNLDGIHKGFALDDEMAEVWAMPQGQDDLIEPDAAGIAVLRLDFIDGQLVLERYE